jgi:hypothetical protein
MWLSYSDQGTYSDRVRDVVVVVVVVDAAAAAAAVVVVCCFSC